MKRTRAHFARHRQAGFSLIEMVAAFLVFAIGIGVLMQVLATSIHNTRLSSDYTMAALWAESKLDTLGVGTQIEAGSSNGSFDDNYSWQLEIRQVDPTSVEPPPQQYATGTAGNSMVRVARAADSGATLGSSFTRSGSASTRFQAPIDSRHT